VCCLSSCFITTFVLESGLINCPPIGEIWKQLTYPPIRYYLFIKFKCWFLFLLLTTSIMCVIYPLVYHNLCFWIRTYKLSSIIWEKVDFLIRYYLLIKFNFWFVLRYLLNQSCASFILLFNHNLCFWVWIEKLSSIIWVIFE
jgi:hypothetical protein